jgi:hypothetical protein
VASAAGDLHVVDLIPTVVRVPPFSRLVRLNVRLVPARVTSWTLSRLGRLKVTVRRRRPSNST